MELMLCTDPDRTLVPNGPETESAQARPCFHRLVERPEVTLTYVTGRNERLAREITSEYDLPTPEYVMSARPSTRSWIRRAPVAAVVGGDSNGLERSKARRARRAA